MKTKKLLLIFWLIFTVLITYMSLSPSFAPPAKYNIDKIGHFGINFIIAFIPALLYRRLFTLYCIAVATISLGIFVEIMQTTVVGREGSIGDVIANSAGVITALIVAYKWKKDSKNHSKKTL